jgi:protein TonB
MAALAGWRVRARETDLRVLAAALAASALLHLAFVLGFPQWVAREHMVILPGPLRARLAPPPAPAPPPTPGKEERREPFGGEPRPAARRAPAPAAPEPVPAGPAPLAQPESRSPAPSTPPAKAVPPQPAGAAPPAPLVEAKPQSATPEASAPAAERAAAAPREAVAAAAPPPAAEEPGTVAQYRIALMEAARGLRSYPRLARENNWEGRVTVRIALAPGGVLAALAVASSSGYPVLDQQALDMIRRAQAKTPVPAALRAREFSVEIPVIFDLRDE